MGSKIIQLTDGYGVIRGTIIKIEKLTNNSEIMTVRHVTPYGQIRIIKVKRENNSTMLLEG